jgi:hypothetical protein
MLKITYQRSIADKNTRSSTCKNINLKIVCIVTLVFIAYSLPCWVSAQDQKCVRRNPTVTISPSSQSGFLGNQLTFRVTVTNNDSGNCSPSTFLVMATFLEASFVHIPDCFRVTLRPGESQFRDILIQAPGNTCVGPKTFRETAMNEFLPDFSGSADSVFDVLPFVGNCGRRNPSVSIEPDLETQTGYLVSITNNDDAFCGASVFEVLPKFSDVRSFQTPASFRILVFPGKTELRRVDIIEREGLLDSVIMQTATNLNDTCFKGIGAISFHILAANQCFCTGSGDSETSLCVNQGTGGTTLTITCLSNPTGPTGSVTITEGAQDNGVICNGCKIFGGVQGGKAHYWDNCDLRDSHPCPSPL